MTDIPTSARVVIIGGGVSGCSVAYHLAKLGWQDIVLLERKQLTCGTTWHAAGLIGQLRNSKNQTQLAKYSAGLYMELEAETGVATGMRQNGSLTVALTDARLEEIRRQATLARAFGVEVHDISPAEVQDLYPHLNVDGVKGAVHLPADGQADPANIALALAKGARMNGAKVIEGVKVTAVHEDRGQVTGISWERGGETGEISTPNIVNCGGMWARDLAAQNNVSLPLHACEHFYIVTEGIEGLKQLPVLRVPDECAYYKEDAGKILLGAFEPRSKPWGMNGIPDDFEFDQLPEDFDHFEPILEMGVNRLPLLGEAGIHTFFNGPESFTPDDRYYLGEAPNVKGYWVAAGYNSIGIVSSGGAGHALSQWMDKGHPPFDLWESDIRRAQPFQRNRSYLRARVTETLGLLYADHYPFRQFETARGVRRAPWHEQMRAEGAVFGETAGWERPNWFANLGQEPVYEYSWGRQNWFDNQRAEHMALREGVGLYDMTSFGKIRVEGPDACRYLNRVCGAEMDIAPGRLAYTQMLNDRGGIEADLTVSRLSETAYLLVTPAATVQRDLNWLARHKGDDLVVVTDVTPMEACLALMGPKARDVLTAVSPDDFTNEAFPFGSVKTIEIGQALARAHRLSYVGEIGWEIYVTADMAAHVLEVVLEAGARHDLKLCGLHAMDSARIEKAFRHWGHDITDEDHVLEAGLGFAVGKEKTGFIGYDAIERKREAGLENRLLQFRMDDPEVMLHHNEGIVRDGQMVGYLTSGNYGHALGASIGMGYVPCAGQSAQEVLASTFEIEVAGARYPAQATLKPLYDPTSARTKA